MMKGIVSIQKQRYSINQSVEINDDNVIEEVPCALIYNGVPHVVIMCTPIDLIDFAYGFSLTEGIVSKFNQIHSLNIQKVELGYEIHIEIEQLLMHRLIENKRQLSARSSCGICGLQSLMAIDKKLPVLGYTDNIDFDVIQKGRRNVLKEQVISNKTGSAHGAFWLDINGNVLISKEDVGRHVALDKLIGAMRELDDKEGFCIVTSRASFEMVQKAISAKIKILVAFSAPTNKAIEVAKNHHLALWGFVRAGSGNKYS